MSGKVGLALILALTFFKLIAVFFTEFDLFSDEAQYWLWSRSIDFGYYSKPPLLSWFLALYTNFFGSTFISLKVFPIIVCFFISFSIYKLCLRLGLSKNSSEICALTFLIMPAASVSSFLISTDLLLLLFWTLSMIKLLDVRESGSKLSFLLLGLFLGLAFLAKYAAVYFLLSLFCLIIIDNKTLAVFKKNTLGIFVFLGSLFFVLAPNIFWNLKNGWVTFFHTSDNANLQNLSLSLYEPIRFLLIQALMIGPIIFVSFVLLIKNLKFDFTNKFLLIFSAPVFIIVLIESFLVRSNANWAAPALISLLVLFIRYVNKERRFLTKINFVFNYFVAVFFFGAILFSSKHGVFDRIRGVGVFSQGIIEIIKHEDLAISDRMVFSSMSYELRNNKNNLYMVYRDGSPITNHFQLTSALKKNTKDDFYLLGDSGGLSYLSKDYKVRLIKEFNTGFSSEKLQLYEVNFK